MGGSISFSLVLLHFLNQKLFFFKQTNKKKMEVENKEEKKEEEEEELEMSERKGRGTSFDWTLVFFHRSRMDSFTKAFMEKSNLDQVISGVETYSGTIFCRPIRIYYVKSVTYPNYLEDFLEHAIAENGSPIFIYPGQDRIMSIMLRIQQDYKGLIVQMANTSDELYQTMQNVNQPDMAKPLFMQICDTAEVFKYWPIRRPTSTPISLSEAYAARPSNHPVDDEVVNTLDDIFGSSGDESFEADEPEPEPEPDVPHTPPGRVFLFGNSIWEETTRNLARRYEREHPLDVIPTRPAMASRPSVGVRQVMEQVRGTPMRAPKRKKKRKKRAQPTEKELEEFITFRRAQYKHGRVSRAEKPVDVSAETMTCKICMDYRVTVVFIPCGHACCCSKCSVKLETKTNASRTLCPMCREPVIFALPFHL